MESPVPESRPVVLCVDDDPAVLRSLHRLFREEPVEVLSTLKPELALKWIGEHEVDVLLTDQRMPGMSGTSLVEEARKCSPRTSCVLLTAYPHEVTLMTRALQEADGLISKPWDGPMLRSTVRQILRERDLEEREAQPPSGDGR